MNKTGSESFRKTIVLLAPAIAKIQKLNIFRPFHYCSPKQERW
jgi:hypothetical protein